MRPRVSPEPLLSFVRSMAKSAFQKSRPVPTPRLEWRGSDGQGQVFLISSSPVVIGRRSDADLVISNQLVSRRHAKLVEAPSGHELVDLGSTYGTYVNDERV